MGRLKTLKSGLQVLGPRLQTINSNSWSAGKTTGERGYNYKWQKARARYLYSHSECVFCMARGLVEPATVVDHIVPHQGDQELFWDESNWQALCKPCHDSVKQRQERALKD